MKLFLYIFLTLLTLKNLYCQIRVLSSSDKTPIEYVNIGVIGTDKGVITDKDGNFSLKDLKTNLTDSVYFSHLSYKYKVLLAKDLKDKVFLETENIELPALTINIRKSKKRVFKRKGFPSVFNISPTLEEDHFDGEFGDFIILEKNSIITEFELNVLKNSLEKAIFRLTFYKSSKDYNSFSTLIEKPIYIEIPYSKKKQIITKEISVFAPKGIIWVGIQLIETKGNKKDNINFKATGTGGWMRHEDKVYKLGLGLGLPFSIKGYEYDSKQ